MRSPHDSTLPSAERGWWRLGAGVGGFVGSAADDGAPDSDVLDAHRVDGEWVVFEHREVGGLAAFDAAELVVSVS